jgi:hypothetical protein
MRVPFLALPVLLLTVGASHLAAEPVRITSGVLSFDSGDPLHFVFESSGGLRMTGFDFFSPDNPGSRCMPCAPGTPIALDATFGPGPLGQGSIGPEGAGTAVYYQGSFHFDTGGVTIPAAHGFTITPFTFTGDLAAFLDPSRTGTPFFEASLMGQGRLVFTLTDYRDPPLLITDDMTYVFGDTAPVPEPATMFLAAAGLGYLARRGVRRQRGRVSPDAAAP